MGYLNTANDIADNSMKLLNDVIDSKFATYLQGNGTPALVTYYNIDEILSTTDKGTYTIDQILGGNSPLRYNRIENFPLFGLTELLPTIEKIEDNLMDMSLDKELIVLPNTIKPTPYDIFIYKFLNGTTITFRVDEFEITSIKNSSFYKINVSLKDINNTDTIDKVEAQTVKGYIAKLDNIGTQDKCIIEDKIFSEISTIESTIKYLIEEYRLMFFDRKYNCILYRNSDFSGYPIYDPYLTLFIEKHDLLDDDSDYTVITNFDNRPEVEKIYKMSIYRFIELRNISKLEYMSVEPNTFRTLDSNPFYYYGEESVFTLSLRLWDGNPNAKIYGNIDLLNSIMSYRKPINPTLSSRPLPDKMKDDKRIPILNYKPVDTMEIKDTSELRADFSKPDIEKKPVSYKIKNLRVINPMDIEDISHGNYPEDKPQPELSYADLSDIYDETFDDDYTSLPIPEEEKPIEIPDALPELSPYYLNFVRNYFINDSLYNLFSIEDIHALNIIELEYNETNFMYIPMLIYVLKEYLKYLVNNK